MTTILKREEFRNNADDATITIEQYQDKGSVPLWRFYVKYDRIYTPVDHQGLTHRPNVERLKKRY